jgi:hypothetical protein
MQPSGASPLNQMWRAPRSYSLYVKQNSIRQSKLSNIQTAIFGLLRGVFVPPADLSRSYRELPVYGLH